MVLLQLACGQAAGAGTPPGRAVTTSPSGAVTEVAGAHVKLSEVATASSPTGMAVRNGDSAIYIIEQGGRVRRFHDGQLDGRPVLDISQMLKSGGEQGLLGIAFSPDGGYPYLDYTDTAGNTQIGRAHV